MVPEKLGAAEGALGPFEAPVGDGPDLDDDPAVPVAAAEDHSPEAFEGPFVFEESRPVRAAS